jgi:branched-chain amino acid transport system ATP-binding protein
MKRLEVSDLRVRIAGIEVVCGIDLGVAAGEALLIVGPNGAGKTSLLRALAGLAQYAGTVRLSGRRLDGLATEERVAAGLAYLPDTKGNFPSLTVEDNLRLGAHLRSDRGAVDADLDALWQRFPRLKDRRRHQAGTLSGGEQQMLALGRVLMTRAKVLLIDEPSAGLAPQMVETVHEAIAAMRHQMDLSLVIVEQELLPAWAAMADRVMFMEAGRAEVTGAGLEAQSHRSARSTAHVAV